MVVILNGAIAGVCRRPKPSVLDGHLHAAMAEYTCCTYFSLLTQHLLLMAPWGAQPPEV